MDLEKVVQNLGLAVVEMQDLETWTWKSLAPAPAFSNPRMIMNSGFDSNTE
jgi:hypothetical protein